MDLSRRDLMIILVSFACGAAFTVSLFLVKPWASEQIVTILTVLTKDTSTLPPPVVPGGKPPPPDLP